MNLLVKRFLVFAVPLLVLGCPVAPYSIQIENNTGIELADLSITDQDAAFMFGDLAERTCKGLGNADLQFGPQLPRQLQVAFKPKHSDRVIECEVAMPIIGRGESVKLEICSRLDLIEALKENRS